MTSLIVIECNPTGIKRDFSFMSMNFLIMYFSESYISELFGMSYNIGVERSTRHLRIELQTNAYW